MVQPHAVRVGMVNRFLPVVAAKSALRGKLRKPVMLHVKLALVLNIPRYLVRQSASIAPPGNTQAQMGNLVLGALLEKHPHSLSVLPMHARLVFQGGTRM